MKLTDEKVSKLRASKKTLGAEVKKLPPAVFNLYPRSFMSILASPPGVGKTWLTLYIAAAGSIGYDVLGKPIIPVKTVIMSGETGTDMLIRRLQSTNWIYDEKNVSLYSSFDLNMAGINTNLETEEGRAIFIQILTDEQPDCVIFDTLIAFHEFDESNQKEMTRLFLYLCKLAHAFNFALVLNHHTRKRSAQNPNRALEQDDIIGSSAGIRLAAAAFILQPQDEERTAFVLKNVKSWSKKIPSISFTMKEKPIDFIIKNNAIEDETIKDEVKTIVLQNAIKGACFRVKDMAIKLDCTERTIRRYLEEYTMPDEELGTILLNRIQVGAETLYVGTLTLAELSSYKKQAGLMEVNNAEAKYKPAFTGNVF